PPASRGSHRGCAGRAGGGYTSDRPSKSPCCLFLCVESVSVVANSPRRDSRRTRARCRESPVASSEAPAVLLVGRSGGEIAREERADCCDEYLLWVDGKSNAHSADGGGKRERREKNRAGRERPWKMRVPPRGERGDALDGTEVRLAVPPYPG